MILISNVNKKIKIKGSFSEKEKKKEKFRSRNYQIFPQSLEIPQRHNKVFSVIKLRNV